MKDQPQPPLTRTSLDAPGGKPEAQFFAGSGTLQAITPANETGDNHRVRGVLEAVGDRDLTAAIAVAIVWANTDPKAAVDWVKEWPEKEARDRGFIAVSYEVARKDPIAAMVVAVDLPAGMERDTLITHTVAQWATTAPDAALDWAKQMQSSELRDQVMKTIAVEWADRDPVAAASLALRELPTGRVQQDAIISIVSRWAQTDPHATSIWVGRFPQGSLRRTAEEILVMGR